MFVGRYEESAYLLRLLSARMGSIRHPFLQNSGLMEFQVAMSRFHFVAVYSSTLAFPLKN